MTRFLPTVAAVALMAVSTGVYAAPAFADAETRVSVTLTYNPADLTSEDRALTLLQRLERQARNACVSVEPIIRTEFVDQTCVADVMTQAVERIESPILTAAFKQID